MHRPYYIIILKDKTVLDTLGQLLVILLEALYGGGSIAKGATKMQNHDCVAVLLRWQLEQREHLIVIH
jgi:hypothetical protein